MPDLLVRIEEQNPSGSVFFGLLIGDKATKEDMGPSESQPHIIIFDPDPRIKLTREMFSDVPDNLDPFTSSAHVSEFVIGSRNPGEGKSIFDPVHWFAL